MSQVFISYPHQKQDDAILFADALEEKGLTTWVATKKLSADDVNWRSQIDEALKAATAVVFFVYSQPKASPWIQHEYMNALDSYWSGRTKFLVPLLVGSNAEPPTFLRHWQCLKVQNTSDWDLAASQLAKWIRSDQPLRSKPSKKEKEALTQRLNAIARVAKRWQLDSQGDAGPSSGSSGSKFVYRSSKTGEFSHSGKKKSRSSQRKTKK